MERSAIRAPLGQPPHSAALHAGYSEQVQRVLFGRKRKNPIKIADKGVVEWKYATCGYCSTGCSIEVGLNGAGAPVASRGVADADVNRGKPWLKGIFEHELFTSAGHGTPPLQRERWRDGGRRPGGGNSSCSKIPSRQSLPGLPSAPATPREATGVPSPFRPTSIEQPVEQ